MASLLAQRRGLSLAAFGVGLTSCRLEVPEGPAMEELAAEYEAPQGILVEDEMVELVRKADEAFRSINALTDYLFILEALQDVAESVSEITLDTDTRLQIRAVSDVTRICRGYGDSDSDDPKNGTLGFRVTVEETEIQDTVWGDFRSCRFKRLGERIEYTGSVRMYLGRAIPLSAFRIDQVLIRLDGVALVAGRERRISWDFRTSQDGHVEVKVPAEDGEVVFGFDYDLSKAAVRTRTGSLCCYFEERTCHALSGDECSEVATGDMRLKW